MASPGTIRRADITADEHDPVVAPTSGDNLRRRQKGLSFIRHAAGRL